MLSPARTVRYLSAFLFSDAGLPCVCVPHASSCRRHSAPTPNASRGGGGGLTNRKQANNKVRGGGEGELFRKPRLDVRASSLALTPPPVIYIDGVTLVYVLSVIRSKHNICPSTCSCAVAACCAAVRAPSRYTCVCAVCLFAPKSYF